MNITTFSLILILVPLFTGLIGIGAAYLQHHSQDTGREYEVDLDQDFFLPFFLALALVIVVTIRIRIGTWWQSKKNNVGESVNVIVDKKEKKKKKKQ